MCTRFVLLEQHYRDILQALGVAPAAEFLSRYNLAPGAVIPAVRSRRVIPEGIVREQAMLGWGLVPAWSASSDGARPVNARAESVAVKPTFRQALRSRRCVIPASGFYEWAHRGQERLPWFFSRQDGQPFGFAGLWEAWRAPDETILETCAFITTNSNAVMQPIHHRMPVMLTPTQFAPWLDPQLSDPELLAPLLQPLPTEDLTGFAVGTYVSNSRHEGPECLTPALSPSGVDTQLPLGF